jgi:hypothetical protein
MASRVHKLSANQYTVIFVKSLLFGAIMSFQENNTNTNETETSKKISEKRTTDPIISISHLIATIGALVLQA